MVFLILAAIIGSAIGFTVLLPMGLLAAFVGLCLGGALSILLAGLVMASARRPAASANTHSAEVDHAKRVAKASSRSQAS